MDSDSSEDDQEPDFYGDKHRHHSHKKVEPKPVSMEKVEQPKPIAKP